MRVLQVHTRYRLPGGEDAVVERERRLLEDAGHEVRQVLAENPEGAGQALKALPLAPWNPRAARAVAEVARSWGPDVVHVHNTWFALSPAVVPAVRRVGVPCVVTLHNYRTSCVNAVLLRDGAPCHDCVGRTPWPGVVHRCYRSSVGQSLVAALTVETARRRRVWTEQTDALVVLTEQARDHFVRAGLPEARLHVVPNVVDPVPARMVRPSDSRTVLYIGRLSPEKGVDLLLAAWRAGAPPGLVLEIVGDGPLADTLGRDLPPGVRMVGQLSQEDVQHRLATARAVVVPSLWEEMFGLVVAESLASGTPVLASARGGPQELLTAAGCAEWLVQADDGWPDALVSLAEGPLARGLDAAGEAVRHYYEQHLTPERGAERLRAVYAAAQAGTASGA